MKRRPVKDRLIKTASKLFYEQGYNRTGINEILKESGVAKASMYQHFRSKDEIGVAYLKNMEIGLMQGLEELLATKEKGKESVLGLIDFVQQFYEQDNFRGCWCQNTISEIPKEAGPMLDEIRLQKRNFKRVVSELLKDNLPNLYSEELSDQLFLLYEVAVLESQLFMQDWPIKRARSIAEKLLE